MSVREQTLGDEGHLRIPLIASALAAYAVAGGTRIAEGNPGPAWWVSWLVFGAAMLGSLTTRALPRARSLWALQLAAAIALLTLGMPHFEGALLALVAAQARRVLSLRFAILAVLLMTVPHFAVIFESHGAMGSLKASGELLAFGVFAIAAYELLWRERAARDAQEQISRELVQTRQRLADVTRQGEQERIGRDLHDELGYRLEVLRDRMTRSAADADSLAALDALAGSVRAAISGISAEPQDLAAALEVLAASLPDVSIEIRAEGASRVPPLVGRTLVRVAQESLTNAARHMEAPAVTWELGQYDGRVRFVATSRGRVREGMLGSGSGLAGLRARVEGEGGAFHSALEGQTFVVEVSLPLEAP